MLCRVALAFCIILENAEQSKRTQPRAAIFHVGLEGSQPSCFQNSIDWLMTRSRGYATLDLVGQHRRLSLCAFEGSAIVWSKCSFVMEVG